jgi:hypothetical protein
VIVRPIVGKERPRIAAARPRDIGSDERRFRGRPLSSALDDMQGAGPDPGTEVEQAGEGPRIEAIAEQELGERRARPEERDRREGEHRPPLCRPPLPYHHADEPQQRAKSGRLPPSELVF